MRGPTQASLRRSSIPSQIVHKQLRVRQVRQAKGRVGVAELLQRARVRAQATDPGVMARWGVIWHLMDNASGGGIHSSATVLWVGGHSEESELAGALEQGAVKTLLAIVLQGLRLHLVLGELLHHLSQSSVLSSRIGRVELLLHRLGRVGECREMTAGHSPSRAVQHASTAAEHGERTATQPAVEWLSPRDPASFVSGRKEGRKEWGRRNHGPEVIR